MRKKNVAETDVIVLMHQNYTGAGGTSPWLSRTELNTRVVTLKAKPYIWGQTKRECITRQRDKAKRGGGEDRERDPLHPQLTPPRDGHGWLHEPDVALPLPPLHENPLDAALHTVSHRRRCLKATDGRRNRRPQGEETHGKKKEEAWGLCVPGTRKAVSVVVAGGDGSGEYSNTGRRRRAPASEKERERERLQRRKHATPRQKAHDRNDRGFGTTRADVKKTKRRPQERAALQRCLDRNL